MRSGIKSRRKTKMNRPGVRKGRNKIKKMVKMMVMNKVMEMIWEQEDLVGVVSFHLPIL